MGQATVDRSARGAARSTRVGTSSCSNRACPDAGHANAAADHFEVFIDGKRLVTDTASQRFAVDTTALGDGWHELRVVAIAAGPLETQSRVILPMVVDNRGGSLTLARENTEAKEVPCGEPLVVRAKAPTARSITILHNGRILGTIDGADGTLNIDTRTLGSGAGRPAGLRARGGADQFQRAAGNHGAASTRA